MAVNSHNGVSRQSIDIAKQFHFGHRPSHGASASIDASHTNNAINI
jgi:hypothetical protein